MKVLLGSVFTAFSVIVTMPVLADGDLPAGQVREIQGELRKRGLYTGANDGIVGPQTELAIRNLQQQGNLQVTGRLDEATLAVLGQRTPEAGRTGGATIRAVQQQLNARGFGAGPVDGVIGERTQVAIREFQARQGLPATGRLDARTVEALGVRAQG